MLENLLHPIPFAQCLTSVFLAVLFLQAGLDKVIDFGGNLAWITSYFAKSPLRGQAKLLLPVVMLAECAAGGLALVGAAQIAWLGETTLSLYGAQLSTITITMLFFGQRMAKDYASAAAMVPYFILCVGAVLLLAH